ncbi:FCD domain-containing protein [Microbacterium betulae]|uniref:FCD domain-containing protein n=1 Tax=Microbacterium betulae TaxID=2981139 RepID=A0AA97I660_9MICO|nr:FCD domain-containing protein [Microbacterium sp. AB]WOF24481.1 FCD domain-containing protein [Microbacterium sp. AB]
MRVHETVMQWVTEELASGRLHIGDHLPGERTLAETLKVSRNSLREALRVLEALGALHTSTGTGPRSGTIVTAAPEQALSLALSLQLATRQVEPHDVLQVRLLLEAWAAGHSDPARGDWAPLERILDRMDDGAIEVEEFLRLDAEFHVRASRAADNPLISTLMDALRIAIFDHTLARAQRLPDWGATSARLRHEHREILDALRHGRGAEAAGLLEAHIRGYYLETSERSPADGHPVGAPEPGA